MAWYSTDELGEREGAAIGRMLEEPRRVTGTEVTVPVKVFSDEAGQKVATGERRAAHVWHCSLSMPPTTPAGERAVPLEDEVWGAIARDFVGGMGFTAASGKSPCRWVAVHHGQSVNGGDHIHVAVQLVREDGTKASTHNDYKTASRVAGELERKHGLEVVAGRDIGRSARPEIRGEVEQAKRAGAAETYSRRLSRTVRACAAGSGSEDEFVRRCRGEELWVRPRFAAGGQDQVTGFAVAEQPPAGQRAVWKAAGHLGRDLTLPRLRERWPGTGEQERAAVAEWRAAWRGAGIAASGREARTPSAGLWQVYSDDVARLTDQLRHVDVNDQATWSRVARETAGVLAAWSLRTETLPGPLADASDQLAHSAALGARHTVQQGRPVSLRGPAYLVLQLAADPSSRTGQALLIRQLANTVRALHGAQQATGQARQAARLATDTRDRLQYIAAALPEEPPRAALSVAEAARADRRAPMGRPYDSPVPARVAQRGEASEPARARRQDLGAER